jgi:hypothetical protein
VSDEKPDRLKTLMGFPIVYDDDVRETTVDVLKYEGEVLDYLEKKCGANLPSE